MDLIGFTVGVIWKGKMKTEEYKIVTSKTNFDKHEINIDMPFAKSLINKQIGDEVCFNVGTIRNQYKLIYINSPTLKEVISNRNITKLYHFTPIENLDSILKHGILSVTLLNEKNIKYIGNDKLRLENRLNCVSCSVEFPNNFVRKVREEELGCRHVLLEIDVNALLKNQAYCCITNAATGSGLYVENIDNFYKLFQGVRYELPDNFPSYEQAEVLIKDCIDPKYINKIIFQSQSDAEGYLNREDVEINSKLFLTRKEYLKR